MERKAHYKFGALSRFALDVQLAIDIVHKLPYQNQSQACARFLLGTQFGNTLAGGVFDIRESFNIHTHAGVLDMN